MRSRRSPMKAPKNVNGMASRNHMSVRTNKPLTEIAREERSDHAKKLSVIKHVKIDPGTRKAVYIMTIQLPMLILEFVKRTRTVLKNHERPRNTL